MSTDAKERPGLLMQDIRVIIADDHRMGRKAWELLLSERRGIRVVGQASDGQELINLLETLKTDIVLMDLDMSVMNGIEAFFRKFGAAFCARFTGRKSR